MAVDMFVPTTGTFDTELSNRTAFKTGNVHWKIEIDHDFNDVYTDYTSYLFNNTVTISALSMSIFKPGGAVTATVLFKNSPKTWDAGDLSECPAKISVKIGSSEYIQIFSGYVVEGGVDRVKKSLTTDVVTVKMHDGSKSRTMRKKTNLSNYIGHKICDTVTPASSIAHKIAAQINMSGADLDFLDIDRTKDYLPLDGKRTVWKELQDLAIQHSALLSFRYDGKLKLTVWTPAEWNTPNIEYTFDDSNVHNFKSIGGGIFCNKAVIEHIQYLALDAGIIYKSYDEFNETTQYNEIVVAAGEYWPGGSDVNTIGRLHYAYNGEEYPVGISIQTPTIGTTGDVDILCSGGALTLESFNGTAGTNPSKTNQNAASSELILYNGTGSPITIQRLEIRGTPLRELAEIISQDVDGTIDPDTEAWKYVEKNIPGKYATSDTHAELTATRFVDFGKERAVRYKTTVDFTPNIQRGAFVTFNPTAGVNITGIIEAYQHSSKGVHGKTRTTITIYQRYDLASVGTGETDYAYTGEGSTEQTNWHQVQIDDRPTYDEVITDGWDTGDGTTTPTQVTVNYCKGFFKAIALSWDEQSNLTNLDHYEIQVSDDQSTWYELEFDGTDWKKGAGDVTVWQDTFLIHTNIPLAGSADDPTEITLYYKVRRVTKLAVNGDWSANANATAWAIAAAYIVKDAINAAKVDAAEFLRPPETSLELHLPLDEGEGTVAKDVSDNEYDGTIVGCTHITGIAGRALNFDGTTQHVEIASDGTGKFDKQEFSISIWAYAASIPDNYPLLWSYDFTSHVAPHYAQHIRIETNRKITFGFNIAGASKSFLTTNAVFNLGEWNHIVITFKTGEQKIWVNGKLEGSDTEAGAITYYVQEVWIGRANFAYTKVCKMDEVRFYSAVLTEAEIKYLYMNPSGVQQTLIDAKHLIAESALIEKLSVLARDFINNISQTYKLNGWGGIMEDGSGSTSVMSLVDATVNGATTKVLRLTSSLNHSIRTKTIAVNHDKIYKLSVWLKKSAVDGLIYLGLSAYDEENDSAEGTGSGAGDKLIDAYDASTRVYSSSLANFYFWNGDQTTWTEYTAYIVGANRSVDDCPKTENVTYIGKLQSDTTHVAFRILNWANTSEQTLDICAPALTEVGAGQVVTQNLVAECVTSTEIEARTILAGDIKTGEITSTECNTTLLNALIADIKEYLQVSSSGWQAGKRDDQSPANLDYKAYLDENELYFQQHNGAAWITRARLLSSASGGLLDLYDGSGNIKAYIAGYNNEQSVQAYFLAGRVGIGMNNPQVLLDLGSTAAAVDISTTQYGLLNVGRSGGNYAILDVGLMGSVNAAWLQARNRGTTAMYDLLLNPLGKNIGIGTPDVEAWHSAYGAIEFHESAVMYGKSLPQLWFINNAYYSTAWFYKSAGKASKVYFYEDYILFSSAPTGTLNQAMTGANVWKDYMKTYDDGTTYLKLGGAAGGSNRNVEIQLATDASIIWNEAANEIDFNKTLHLYRTKELIPEGNATYDLGTSSLYWDDCYLYDITTYSLTRFNSNAHIGSVGSSFLHVWAQTLNYKYLNDYAGLWIPDNAYEKIKTVESETENGYCELLESKGLKRLKFSHFPDIFNNPEYIAEEDVVYKKGMGISEESFEQVNREIPQFSEGDIIIKKGEKTRMRIDKENNVIFEPESLQLNGLVSYMLAAQKKMIEKIEALEKQIFRR